jgi:hypothetical protein
LLSIYRSQLRCCDDGDNPLACNKNLEYGHEDLDDDFTYDIMKQTVPLARCGALEQSRTENTACGSLPEDKCTPVRVNCTISSAAKDCGCNYPGGISIVAEGTAKIFEVLTCGNSTLKGHAGLNNTEASMFRGAIKYIQTREGFKEAKGDVQFVFDVDVPTEGGEGRNMFRHKKAQKQPGGHQQPRRAAPTPRPAPVRTHPKPLHPTRKPVDAKKPETHAPVDAKKPVVPPAHAPVHANKPETHAPVETKKPETHAPVEAKKPDTHSQVTVDAKKPETHAPVEIKKPETHAPVDAKKPETHSQVPVDAKKPETHTPVDAKKPETHAPVVIKKPETNAPVDAKKPVMPPGQAPPVETKKPETHAPVEAKKPETHAPVDVKKPEIPAPVVAKQPVVPPSQAPVDAKKPIVPPAQAPADAKKPVAATPVDAKQPAVPPTQAPVDLKKAVVPPTTQAPANTKAPVVPPTPQAPFDAKKPAPSPSTAGKLNEAGASTAHHGGDHDEDADVGIAAAEYSRRSYDDGYDPSHYYPYIVKVNQLTINFVEGGYDSHEDHSGEYHSGDFGFAK